MSHMARGRKCAWTLGITGIKAAKCFQKAIFPSVSLSYLDAF